MLVKFTKCVKTFFEYIAELLDKINIMRWLFSFKFEEVPVTFKLTQKSLEELQQENIPEDIINSLENLVNIDFESEDCEDCEDEFKMILRDTIGEDQVSQYEPIISKYTYNNFPDVNSSDWYYNFVERCKKHGIMNGIGDGDIFNPSGQMNRAQAATAIFNAYQ